MQTLEPRLAAIEGNVQKCLAQLDPKYFKFIVDSVKKMDSTVDAHAEKLEKLGDLFLIMAK